jgi:lipid II:glycine glycyltransferase (peptidoglycan interpeptide bridge formation enzyme)
MYIFKKISFQSNEYDKFIKKFENIHFTQTPVYFKFLSDVYNYKVISVACSDKSDNIIAILSGVVEPKIIGKDNLNTSPFYEYGGLIASCEIESNLFISEFKSFMRGNKINSWTFNYNNNAPKTILDTIATHKKYKMASMVLQDENNLFNNVHSSVRKSIRKSIKSNLKSERVCSSKEIASFYQMYVEHMKNKFGTPPYSLKHFQRLENSFTSDFWLVKVSKDLVPVAYLLSISSKNRIHLLHVVDSKKHRILRPADFAHWKTFLLAYEQRIRWVDFGYVNYPGQESYKKKWGGVIESASDKILFANNKKYNRNMKINEHVFFRKIWSLLPLKLTVWIGPAIRKIMLK